MNDREHPYTVEKIYGAMNRLLEVEYAHVYVVGEVSGYKKAGPGSHVYFNLIERVADTSPWRNADGGRHTRTLLLSCAMWRSTAARQRGQRVVNPYTQLENGMKVLVKGKPQAYDERSSLSIHVDAIEPLGEGLLRAEFERVRAMLEERGMFDAMYKKPLPQYPKRVVVVTSTNGKAWSDGIRTMQQLNPCLQIILRRVRVEGEGAVDSIIRGICAADAVGADVILLCRGGGMAESLRTFNDERLAEAIFGCVTPIITAIGHSQDEVTIADLVADHSEITPTAGGRAAVGASGEALRRVIDDERALERGFEAILQERRQRLLLQAQKLRSHAPEQRIRLLRSDLKRLAMRYDGAAGNKMMRWRHFLSRSRLRLAHSSPERLLQQGRERTSRYGAAMARQDVAQRIRRARECGSVHGRALDRGMDLALERSRTRYALLWERLRLASPVERLRGGYGYVQDAAGRAVLGIGQLAPGSGVHVQLKDGSFTATVDTVEQSSGGREEA